MLLPALGAGDQQKRFAQVWWENVVIAASRLLLQALSKVRIRDIRVMRLITWERILLCTY
jgi:hypothetical protein